METKKSLSDYAKEKSTFITIKPGDSYTAVYRGFKFIEKEGFGETREYARYLLEDLEDKKVRTLDSMSASLADRMADVSEGDTIIISRTGKGMDTKYEVKATGDKSSDVGEIPVVEDEIPLPEEPPF